MTEDEYGGRRIRWRAAAGSGKSAGHFSHRKTSLFKNPSDATGDFKN
jgi:hypothetical protein